MARPKPRRSRGKMIDIEKQSAEQQRRHKLWFGKAAPKPTFDALGHARLSRACWLARAREARAGDGLWGQRTLAECVEGARVWHRHVLAALRA